MGVFRKRLKMKIFVENRVVDFESFEKTFEELNVSPESKLVHYGSAVTNVEELVEGYSYNVVECLDGGKKKKKKKYNTPKRIPGKKKKVKLHVLQYYKTDSRGFITRTKKMCPSGMCGPGVFLATHHDRNYCGRCFTTFVVNKNE